MSEAKNQLSRRTVFAGMGAAGAVAAVATTMPLARAPQPQAEVSRPVPEKGGGYALTEHVKRYYKTARV